MGKSRLVLALAERAFDRGVTVAFGPCSPDGPPPLWPWRTVAHLAGPPARRRAGRPRRPGQRCAARRLRHLGRRRHGALPAGDPAPAADRARGRPVGRPRDAAAAGAALRDGPEPAAVRADHRTTAAGGHARSRRGHRRAGPPAGRAARPRGAGPRRRRRPGRQRHRRPPPRLLGARAVGAHRRQPVLPLRAGAGRGSRERVDDRRRARPGARTAGADGPGPRGSQRDRPRLRPRPRRRDGGGPGARDPRTARPRPRRRPGRRRPPPGHLPVLARGGAGGAPRHTAPRAAGPLAPRRERHHPAPHRPRRRRAARRPRPPLGARRLRLPR